MAVKTLQRWDREGWLKDAARTHANRRLYTQEQLNQLLDCMSKTKQVTIAYLRVSSQAQKPDPSNQKAALEQFCIARGIAVDECLARSGYELLVHLCETHGCQIAVLNTESLSPEQETVQDLMRIVHYFSSRLYGMRNYRKTIQKAITDDQGAQNPAQSIT